MFISNLNASWMDNPVSFYAGGHSDTSPGRALTLRQILLEEFIYSWPAICALKALDKEDQTYEQKKRSYKGQLAAYALNLLESRKGQVLQYSNLMQFDWDYDSIKDYDISELMEAIFDLPFIAFCGRSCTGTGFYAFALISEPEKLKQYAEHCFEVFDRYSIPVDTSKGRNYNDLRYVSYDCRMMIKDDPTPLTIKKFHSKKQVIKTYQKQTVFVGYDGRIATGLQAIAQAPTGNRWPTVQKVAYTLGGLQNASLDEIIDTIKNSPQYSGYEDHCIKCAEDSFNAGRLKPLS